MSSPPGSLPVERLAALLSRADSLLAQREAIQNQRLVRLRNYELALHETVSELEQTRFSFRSTLLRDLRVRIEGLLQSH